MAKKEIDPHAYTAKLCQVAINSIKRRYPDNIPGTIRKLRAMYWVLHGNGVVITHPEHTTTN